MHLELSMIRQMGYAAYFLTVADIVADIKTMGIFAACRGSAAGSLVCYVTGISDVDALRHDLSFERFLNPMREELPDVDIDVESARREDVYDMILTRHGHERAACVAMVDTYRARSAVREVGKALGLPEVEVGVVAKAFPPICGRDSSGCPNCRGCSCRCASSICCSGWPSGSTGSRGTSRCTRAASCWPATTWCSGCRLSAARAGTA
jgi:DNA polymerase III alpha subunit